jgi:ribosomal protein S25
VGGSTSSASAASPAPARKRGPGRPKGATTKAAAAKPARKARAGKGRAGRRKGSGTRALEALSFVQGQPGITIPELAAKMGIKQNYLYRVLPGLEQENKVQKQGRGWHPAGS